MQLAHHGPGHFICMAGTFGILHTCIAAGRSQLEYWADSAGCGQSTNVGKQVRPTDHAVDQDWHVVASLAHGERRRNHAFCSQKHKCWCDWLACEVFWKMPTHCSAQVSNGVLCGCLPEAQPYLVGLVRTSVSRRHTVRCTNCIWNKACAAYLTIVVHVVILEWTSAMTFQNFSGLWCLVSYLFTVASVL